MQTKTSDVNNVHVCAKTSFYDVLWAQLIVKMQQSRSSQAYFGNVQWKVLWTVSRHTADTDRFKLAAFLGSPC